MAKNFMKLDKDLLESVKKRLDTLPLNREGLEKFISFLVPFREIIIKKLGKENSYALEKSDCSRCLYQAYLVTALVLRDSRGVSAEEEVFNVCYNKPLYGGYFVIDWDHFDIHGSPEHPSLLILPIEYLKQLGYKGAVVDRKIYKSVRKDYRRYKRWIKNFKVLSEEELRKDKVTLFGELEINKRDRF